MQVINSYKSRITFALKNNILFFVYKVTEKIITIDFIEH